MPTGNNVQATSNPTLVSWMAWIHDYAQFLPGQKTPESLRIKRKAFSSLVSILAQPSDTVQPRHSKMASATIVQLTKVGGNNLEMAASLPNNGSNNTPKTVEMPTAGSLGIPEFEDPYQAREYLKGRLALAFRIFAKLGYDEGVAGHITLKVCKA